LKDAAGFPAESVEFDSDHRSLLHFEPERRSAEKIADGLAEERFVACEKEMLGIGMIADLIPQAAGSTVRDELMTHDGVGSVEDFRREPGSLNRSLIRTRQNGIGRHSGFGYAMQEVRQFLTPLGSELTIVIGFTGPSILGNSVAKQVDVHRCEKVALMITAYVKIRRN